MIDSRSGGGVVRAGNNKLTPNSLIPFLASSAITLVLLSCGMSHNHEVDGSVEVEIKLDTNEFKLKLESVCDREIDGVAVYATRDEYKACVSSILEAAGKETPK